MSVDINERIKLEMKLYKVSSGKDARRLYLGRNQMQMLLLWAYENQYASSPDANIEGEHRPEVQGLLCWEVNDDDHVACA